ncbi:hypothetical protein HRI_005205100 [Hibiscus trionum]|uniref:Uncharacterized protein n=1 Tax=Hibiscus trionum TaxID=183268 RepID=A0A9W7JMG2_HIBTR|nr:hypothetical protein HRI_005205100 [Hibiscus trionum]
MPLPKPDRNIIDNKCAEDDQEEQEEVDSNSISTHLYIKPSHSKQVVLRRIRHRQRMNNFRSALQSFIGSSSSSSPPKTNRNKASGPEIKWLDDAFAAL